MKQPNIKHSLTDKEIDELVDEVLRDENIDYLIDKIVDECLNSKEVKALIKDVMKGNGL